MVSHSQPPALVAANQLSPLCADDTPHATKRLAQGAVSMFTGRFLSFGLQAAYFILLARLLGNAQEYGIFSGVYALVAAVTPYSAAGSAMLFVRHVAGEGGLARVYWGNALLITSLFTSAVCLAALLAGGLAHQLGHPCMTAILLLANCLFSQVTVLASMLFFSLDQLRLSALMNTISNAARLIAVVILEIFMHHISAWQWTLALAAASLTAALYAGRAVHQLIGFPTINLRLLRLRLGEGLGFSYAGGTEAVNNDIDKMMLAHFGLNAQNGFYTLAYRVVDFATSPISSIAASVTQRQFQLARSGVAPVVHLARRSLSVSVGIGVLTVLPLVAARRYIPRVIGQSYADAAQVIYWLCWLPAIRAAHQLAGAAVTGLGRQPLRTATQTFAAVLSVVLNYAWIPKYGWKGAAVATLCCDGSMAVLNLAILAGLSGGLISIANATRERDEPA